MNTTKRKSRAFSLIELMVVIAIVGLLAAVAMPTYKIYKHRATKAKIMSYIETYRNAWLQGHATGNFPESAQLNGPSDIVNWVDYNNQDGFSGVNNNGANPGVSILFNGGPGFLDFLESGVFINLYAGLGTEGVITWTCGYRQVDGGGGGYGGYGGSSGNYATVDQLAQIFSDCACEGTNC